MKLVDKNDIEFKNGDIIDIHQTVNGQNLFVVFVEGDSYSATYIDGRPYEYDVMDLLDCKEMFTLDKEVEIIGNVRTNPELLKKVRFFF